MVDLLDRFFRYIDIPRTGIVVYKKTRPPKISNRYIPRSDIIIATIIIT